MASYQILESLTCKLDCTNLALGQTYQQSLQRLSLLYLRTGKQVSYEAGASAA